MNELLNLVLLAYGFSFVTYNDTHRLEISCEHFYEDIKYTDLQFQGTLKSKSSEDDFYRLAISTEDQTVQTLKLFKNSLSSEIFKKVSVNDILKKNAGENTLRIGYYVGSDIDVKLYDGLCR